MACADFISKTELVSNVPDRPAIRLGRIKGAKEWESESDALDSAGDVSIW
jgi:hypothetical protein